MALRKKKIGLRRKSAAARNLPNDLKVLKVPNDLKAFIYLSPYALFRLL